MSCACIGAADRRPRDLWKYVLATKVRDWEKRHRKFA